MADERGLECQCIDTGAWLRHMGQSVDLSTGELHLRREPQWLVGAGGCSLPPPFPMGLTLLCLLREWQESPSVIHMLLKVLLMISHSCQMLGKREAAKQ